jgi:ferredoxin
MRYIMNGASLAIDDSRCVGCGLCEDICPHGAIAMGGGKAIVADRGLCMECGACAKNCPAGAIEARKGVGCAQAIIGGMLRGGEPSCGCASKGSCC